MKRINGLDEYVRREEYRKALDLPANCNESYELLAQGEYNINYSFVHPITGHRLLLRVNIGSQMHLDNQIYYEAKALQLLEPTGRTPKVLYVDGSKTWLDYGVLVMEYLPGVSIDYESDEDMKAVAECLADIHAHELPSEGMELIAPENPLKAMIDECEEMVRKYMESELGDDLVKIRLRRLLDKGGELEAERKIEEAPKASSGGTTSATTIAYRCCINTELNSTNFLIDRENRNWVYLIDWEKPLYGDPAQDLGHLLAPTTTFWKTNTIYSEDQVDRILGMYIEAVAGRYNTEGLIERAKLYLMVTCLRGLTWCAMAWVEYQDPDKLIKNESTRRKLDEYLSNWMLRGIEERFGLREEL